MTPPHTIWIEAEDWPPGEWDPADDTTDVVVTLDDGSRWIAAFCAFGHLATLRARCAESGENLAGRYLWASDLILVEDTARPTIEAVVADLLARGDLASAFGRLEAGDGDGDDDPGPGPADDGPGSGPGGNGPGPDPAADAPDPNRLH